MAGSVNKVILIGNLGKDPEVRTFPSGDKVVNLTLATSESWKEKSSGERKEKTEWHRVSIYNQGLINVAESYLKKGSKIYIEGSLETRKWTDKDGVEKYSTEIALRPFRSELTMLDSKPKDGTKEQSKVDEIEHPHAPAGWEEKHAAKMASKNDGYKPLSADQMDDSIPF